MKQNTLQPKLRFPEFEGDWEKVTLDQISEIKSGGTPSRSNTSFWNGNIPWITTSLVDYNDIYISEEFITEEAVKESSAKFFPINTILMAMYGQGNTRGKVSLLKIEATTNQACAAIILNKKNSYDFIYQNLVKSYDDLRNSSNEGGQKNLSLGIIRGFKINIPSLPEQHKIADYLSTIDTKINLLEEKREQLTRYKKAMMQKLFSQEIRFKPTERHTELVEVYPDWEEKRLGDVFTGLKGQGLSKDSLSDGGKNNCILYGELFTKYNEVIKSVISQTDVLGNISSKGGDVLIPASTTTNAFDLANATALLLDNVILGGDINILRPKQKVSSEFYAYYLSNFKKRELGKLGQGITIVHLYYTHFKNIMIDIPSLPEQQKIADFLSAIDESIEKVNEQITQTQSFKKAMLQQMFV